MHFAHRFKSGFTEIWHQRLGHPQFSALQLLKNKGLIEVEGATKINHICDSCQLGKLSKFPFSSSNSSTAVFDKIYFDLWGPAPVLSSGKFRFDACLVDDFSKYSWFIPLQHKSDFFDAYIMFERYVERQFNKKIKIFHSDGGGEFLNSRLTSHFLAYGSSSLVSLYS